MSSLGQEKLQRKIDRLSIFVLINDHGKSITLDI